MRVQSARAKEAGRVKFMFQSLLNALMHRIKWREYRHWHRHGSAGLLRSSEQGSLTPHRRRSFANGHSI
jgi:hypothetical protein